MTARFAARTILVAGLILVAWAAPAASQDDAGGEQVIEVRIRGNEAVSDGVIRAMLKTRPGRPFSPQVVKDDEARLLASGRFDSVLATRRSTEGGVIITFQVTERPTVRGLRLVGNKSIKTSDLLAELTFGRGDALSSYAVEAGRQAIANEYNEKGFARVRVTVDEQSLADDRVVIYRIVEGPRIRVRAIRFEGNESFNRWRLRGQVGSSARLWPLLAGNLDPEQVQRDVAAIRRFYVNEGFLDAEVGRRLEYNEKRDRVTLTFVIREGPRFRVNEIVFKGNEIISGEDLAGRLKLGRGEFLNALTLQRDLGRVRSTYGEVGFIETGVTVRKRYLSPQAPVPAWARGLDEGEPALVDLVFTVREGPRYRVGEIDVRGNDITQERVIRRELRLFPRQWYNSVAAEESQSRLMQTTLFNRVDITPIDAPQEGVKDVSVEVVEGKSARFIVGAGVSSTSGLIGTISVTERNFDLFRWPRSFRDWVRGQAFKGAGQRFSINAEPGTELNRFYVDWSEPRLFDLRYSLSTRAFLFERERESYDETRYGGVVSVGHRFKNRWYGELATRIESVELDDLESSIAPEIRADADQAVMTGLKVTLVRDRTDSRWQPSRGDRLRLSYEQVLGGYNFGNLYGDYRIYRTLYVDALDRKHILAGRVAAGRILGDAPVYEHYYGGGLGSVRGFKHRGISPRSVANDDPIGGEFMVYAGTEYTFPLIGEQLRGVVFLDTGTVEETFEVVTYRVSAGFGVRWTVAFFGPVPMSLDFGFPIVKDEQDDERIFNFSIGWEF